MKHKIEVVSGEWVNKQNVMFAGAVFFSGNDRLLVADVTYAEVVKVDGKLITVEVKAIGWEMIAIMPRRAYQAIKTHRTVNQKIRLGQSLDTYGEVAAHHQQEKAEGCRTCGS